MKEPVYGFPCVDDPNDFIPDEESCTPEELATHKKALETWGTADYQAALGSEWITNGEGVLVHILRSTWGMGVNMVEMDEASND